MAGIPPRNCIAAARFLLLSPRIQLVEDAPSAVDNAISANDIPRNDPSAVPLFVCSPGVVALYVIVSMGITGCWLDCGCCCTEVSGVNVVHSCCLTVDWHGIDTIFVDWGHDPGDCCDVRFAGIVDCCCWRVKLVCIAYRSRIIKYSLSAIAQYDRKFCRILVIAYPHNVAPYLQQ